jgi:hypothetical protein
MYYSIDPVLNILKQHLTQQQGLLDVDIIEFWIVAPAAEFVRFRQRKLRGVDLVEVVF